MIVPKPRMKTIVLMLLFCLSAMSVKLVDYLHQVKMFASARIYRHIELDLEKKNIALGDVIGAGSYGIVVSATQKFDKTEEELAVKFMKHSYEEECQQMKVMIDLQQEGAKHTIELYFIQPYVVVEPKASNQNHRGIKQEEKTSYFCVIGLKKGEGSLEERRFNDLATSVRERDGFYKTIYLILEGIMTLNFKADYLHGDIKPENIVLVKTGTEYEPRIIDFDKTFKLQEEMNIKNRRGTNSVLYSPKNMPPELQKFVQDNKYSEESFNKYLETYEFSRTYLEDSYALGKTLQQLIQVNGLENVKNDGILTSLKTIAIKLSTTLPQLRMTTYEAFHEFKWTLQTQSKVVTSLPQVKRSPEIYDRIVLSIGSLEDQFRRSRSPLNLISKEKRAAEQKKSEDSKNILIIPKINLEKIDPILENILHSSILVENEGKPDSKNFGVREMAPEEFRKWKEERDKRIQSVLQSLRPGFRII